MSPWVLALLLSPAAAEPGMGVSGLEPGSLYYGDYRPRVIEEVGKVPREALAAGDRFLAERLGPLAGKFLFERCTIVDMEAYFKANPELRKEPKLLAAPYELRYRYADALGAPWLVIALKLDAALGLQDEVPFPECAKSPRSCEFIDADAALKLARRDRPELARAKTTVSLTYDRERGALAWLISFEEEVQWAGGRPWAGHGSVFRIHAATGEILETKRNAMIWIR